MSTSKELMYLIAIAAMAAALFATTAEHSMYKQELPTTHYILDKTEYSCAKRGRVHRDIYKTEPYADSSQYYDCITYIRNMD